MYLLSSTSEKEKIELYSFEPIKSKMREYKISKIEQIPYENRILVAVAAKYAELSLITPRLTMPTGQSIDGNFNQHIWSYSECPCYIIEGKDYDERYTQVINEYLYGNFSNCLVKYDYFCRLSPTREAYLLITDEYREINEGRHIMHNIIQLPRELFILQFLEQGNFNILTIEEANSRILRRDEDISQQLELFNIDPIKQIDLNPIFDLENHGIISETYDKIIEQAQIGSKILSKVKK